MEEKLLNQYTALPLIPGKRTDFTKPLLLELFDKGQGGEVLKALYMVDLKVEEHGGKLGYKITAKVNGERRKKK